MQADEKVRVESGKDAAEWLLGKLKQKPVPKHQHKGPIWTGRPKPPAVVTCRACTMMFGRRNKKGHLLAAVGVPKRHWKKHHRDHKLGRIKAVKA